jgi:tetratricopeptide (TPR) repeat protein
MGRQKYLAARRHLTAALVHRPDNPRYHYQMALALDTDTRGDLDRAAEHYRRSLQLDPDQPDCLADFGLLALRLDRTDEGLTALRRAAQLAADDPVVVGKLLEGLWQADRPEEARQALRAALFRNPRASQFRKLASDFHFRQLREQQEATRRRRLGDAETTGPVLLPFLRPVPSSPAMPVVRKILRRDAPTPLPPPHLPRRVQRSDQKHA